MTGAWRDSDMSDSDGDKHQAINLSLIAKEGQVSEEEIKFETSDEVDCSVFLKYLKMNWP